MGKGIAGLEAAYRGLFTAVLIILAVLVILCLLRAIIGPRTADRIVSVNMMGTMVIVIIGILTVMMGEGYLADICIIYAMISFLAVIVLTKVYMGVYMEKKQAETMELEKAGNKAAARTDNVSGEPVRSEENLPKAEPEKAGNKAAAQTDRVSGKPLINEENLPEVEAGKAGKERSRYRKAESRETEFEGKEPDGEEVPHGCD